MDAKEADLLLQDFSRHAKGHCRQEHGANPNAGSVIWSILGITMAATVLLSALYA